MPSRSEAPPFWRPSASGWSPWQAAPCRRVRCSSSCTLQQVIRAFLAAACLWPTLASAQPCASPSFALPVDLGLPSERLVGLGHADVDGDGREDLLASLLSGPVVVYWSRAGGLVRGPEIRLGVDGRRIVARSIIDLDGDGRADAFVVTAADEAPFRRFESWLGDGAGGFARVASVPLDARDDLGLTLLRVDGGRFLDVLAVAHSKAAASKLRVLRWRGRGDGTFLEPTEILTLDDPFPGQDAWHDLVGGDVDGDGRTDLAISSGFVWTGFHYASSLWLGDAAGGFSRSDPSPTRQPAFFADVDGDGRDELVFDEQGKLREVGILRRLTDGTWSTIARWSPSGGVRIGELDRDPTRAEVLVSEHGLGVYRLGDTGAVRFATIPASSPSTLLDVDGDGHLDVVAVANDPGGYSSRLVVARSICGPGPVTLFLPALLSLTGAEATRFETEVTVTNVGVSAVSAVLRLHPADRGPESILSSFTLEPGRIRVFSTAGDAGTEWLVLPEGADRGTATLELTTPDGSPQDVVADVRVLSQRPGTGRGGVGFRARPAAEQRVGTTGDVAWLKEDAEDRTNLAVASTGEDPVTLRVTVVSADPERPGRVVLPDVGLPPYGSYQWNRVLTGSGLGARSGWARIERTGGGPWTAWATINSNGTGDGSVVETATTGDELLPAIVGTDRYRTDIVLTNTDARDKTATLRLPSVAGEVSLSLEIGAESSRLVDLVAALRGVGAIPPGPWVGHATAIMAYPAGARVTTTASSSGAFGVYTPAARFHYGETMLVSGLRQDDGNRTNLAIVVADLAPPSRFRVELFDGRTGALARTIEEVAPGLASGAPSRVQLDSVLWGTGIPYGWARVVRTSGGSSFFAYAVVNDGAAPGLGSGDGTYLPGIPR